MRSILNKLGQVSRAAPIKQSVWPHFDLIYVHSNNLLLTINHKINVAVEEHRAILIYPGTTFSGSSTGRSVTTISVHHFSFSKKELPTLPPKLRQMFLSRQPFMKFSRTEMLNDDISRLLKWEYRKENAQHAFMLDALISLVMVNLIVNFQLEQPSPCAAAMMGMDEYIRQNIGKSITPSLLAQRAGLSVNYFRVLFADFFKMPPAKYVNMIKMKEAAKLLSETLLPIKAVAQKIGFDQPSNFHRSFLKFHKTTPRQFRKTNHLAG